MTAQAYWSSVFTSSADQTWAVVRRFNGLPDWHPAIRASEITEGGDGLTPVRSASSPGRTAAPTGNGSWRWTMPSGS
ncbi:SRPBCC family protein [Streptomyces sp. NPDC047525]|uniref:SRPBCC family protein n=1 Tax=Streptomyces sp. NPDC047525 TaxID=3155264 RepID=UPI0033CD4445